jgi:phosphonate metabolism protein PhnN/1,5-bisphosphokinase (PRPP-forming)
MRMPNSGQLFLIVGNSGSGKDSLLQEVLQRWPASARPIRIAQRYITRPVHKSEPFISVTSEAFENLKQRGKFCLAWHVYGTDYGVPVAMIKWLQQGDAVIVNVSRKIIPQARQRIPGLKVIFVSVPLAVTLLRIKARSRESEDEPGFQQRLARAMENQTLTGADFVVDNSQSLETAAAKLLGYILSL